MVENVFTFINSSLFCLGVALALLGRPMDALDSTGVIALNILVSVVQEIRAKRTLDHIALLTRPTASVMRAGQIHAVAPEELVVGDLLMVGPGDQIVVDGSVIGDGRMQVDESQLTGESQPIPKQAGDAVLSGSFCVSGSATYVAERVGAQSFSNQITAGGTRLPPCPDAAPTPGPSGDSHHVAAGGLPRMLDGDQRSAQAV